MANGDSQKNLLPAKTLAKWVAEFSLAVSLLYTLLFAAASLNETFFVLTQRSMTLYHVESVLVSPTLDVWVWGGAVLFASGWLSWTLWSSRTGGRPRSLPVLFPFALVGLAGAGLMVGPALALASLVVAALSFIFSADCFGARRFWLARNVAVCVVSVGLFVEVASLVLFNVPAALNLTPPTPSITSHWNIVSLSFSNLAFAALPYFYLLLIILGVAAFALAAFPIRNALERRGGGKFSVAVRRLRESVKSVKSSDYNPVSCRFPLAAALVIAVLVTCLLVTITVLPWINPTFRLVSVDAPEYCKLITQMRRLNINSALSFAVINDRAAFLVFSYFLSFAISPAVLVQFMPALLISLFCVVSLLVLRLFCGLHDALIFSVLIAPFSFQALGLIYSGYFANMLAVLLVFVYLFLLMRASQSRSSLNILALLLASVGILFSHPWTWFVFALSLGAFLFLEWRSIERGGNSWGKLKEKATLVGITVIVGLICDFARNLLSAGSSSASVSATIQSSLGLPSAAFLLDGLRETVNFYLGGVFANQVLFFLFFVGFLFMLSYKSEGSNFLVSWFFVSCVSMLFASQEFVFNRFLFLMPSAVFGGLGLSYVVRVASGSLQGSKVKKIGVEVLVLAFVFSALLVGSLRYVTNLNLL